MRIERAAPLLKAALAGVLLASVAGHGARRRGGGRGRSGKVRRRLGELARATTTSRTCASLQRGARNFISYCLGCHSLKYER